MKFAGKFFDPNTSLSQEPTVVSKLSTDRNYVLAFDQATNTGMAIFTEEGELAGILYITKEATENVYEYKIKFMSFLKEFIEKYKVQTIIHEKVYGGVNFDTTKNLILIEGLFEELKYTYGFNYKVFPIINTVWKSTILDEPLKPTSVEQKYQIKAKVVSVYPYLENASQDVLDSVGIGLAYFKVVKENVFRLIKLTKGEFNRRTSPKYEILECNEGEQPDLISYINSNATLSKLFEKKGIVGVEYDESFDLFDYMKMAVTHFDSLVALFVFDNRKMGSICLRLGIPYKKGKYFIILVHK